VRHFHCLTPRALLRIVVNGINEYLFHFSIYFHPNLTLRGWEAVKLMYNEAMDKLRHHYQREQEESMDDGKAKGKGKGKEKEKVEGQMKLFAREMKLLTEDDDLITPRFPSEPDFWTYGVRGSEIGLWPPYFFNAWINKVAKGGVLDWDPPSTSPSPVLLPSTLGLDDNIPGIEAPSPSLSSMEISSASQDREQSLPVESSTSTLLTQRLQTPPDEASYWKHFDDYVVDDGDDGMAAEQETIILEEDQLVDD
jgi:hypothetical protein